MHLLVNEIYGPVEQGEGKSAGMECLFLRLSGCNLACDWCDTPYTWNWIGTNFVHPDKYDPKLEAHKMSIEDVRKELYKRVGQRNLVISGGEPLLQQVRLIYLIQELIDGKDWWIEVETNGTIIPVDSFTELVSQFNCSPKTSNSGPDNPLDKRLNAIALRRIAAEGKKATFKFVVQSDGDLEEISFIMKQGGIVPDQVWLMPEGRTQNEQLIRQEQVQDLAKNLGYHFSPRLHILEFGNKRAV